MNVAVVLSVLVALIVGVVVGALVTRSRSKERVGSSTLAVAKGTLDGPHAGDVAAQEVGTSREVEEVGTVLVPVGDRDFPDVYLALGPSAELEALASEGTWKSAGNSVAVANMVAQSIQGYTEAATLVRLSPETVSLMKSGAEVIKGPGGFNYGVLRDPSSGKFVGQVKWAKAGSAVSTVAALGNALTMAMIQMQLNAISDQVAALAKSVDRMSASLRYGVDADLKASVKAIAEVRQQAEISGMVTDRQLRAVQGQSRDLDAHLRRLESECTAALRRLNAVNSQKERLSWLREDGIPALKALNEMGTASRAWVTSRALEAANLLSPENNDESVQAANRRTAEVLIEQTRERMRELDRLLGELGYQFARVLDLVEKTVGKVTLQEKVAGKVVPVDLESDRLKDLAAAIRSQLDALGINIAQVPPLRTVPEVGGMRGEDDQTWRHVIPLMLNPDETVQLILHGRGVGGHHNMSTAYSAIVVTDQRLLAFRKGALACEGIIRLNEPITRVQGLKSKTAFTHQQLRITLREGPIPLLGGLDVDLGMTSDEVEEAIRAITPILAGTTVFAPQGPNFDEALRRLDGGPRWVGEVNRQGPTQVVEEGRLVGFPYPWESDGEQDEPVLRQGHRPTHQANSALGSDA
jgi:uncharacterized protein YecT (DUF1311 family)